VAKRADDFAGGMFGTPWPVPRAYAPLQIGNDAVGDAGIDVGLGLAQGPFSLIFAKQRRLLPARQRDRGVQTERGFSGPLGCTEPESFTEAKEAGAETPCSATGGWPLSIGRKPNQAASAAIRPCSREGSLPDGRASDVSGPVIPAMAGGVEPGPDDGGRLRQYSSGSRSVVTERSASVVIQTVAPVGSL
jgi:hypothetical protein